MRRYPRIKLTNPDSFEQTALDVMKAIRGRIAKYRLKKELTEAEMQALSFLDEVDRALALAHLKKCLNP